jgi:hypothetical protein
MGWVFAVEEKGQCMAGSDKEPWLYEWKKSNVFDEAMIDCHKRVIWLSFVRSCLQMMPCPLPFSIALWV